MQQRFFLYHHYCQSFSELNIFPLEGDRIFKNSRFGNISPSVINILLKEEDLEMKGSIFYLIFQFFGQVRRLLSLIGASHEKLSKC